MKTSLWSLASRYVPAGLAHDLARPAFLARACLAPESGRRWRSFLWNGLEFRNPFGVAGGFDKNCEMGASFQSLGAGFHEVGTITPLPQKANPGRILMRDHKRRNLWNRMGFPNRGAEEAAYQLKKVRNSLRLPLFVNIGKNRSTPLSEAARDYQTCAQLLKDYADVFVVNISSPNTPHLRSLQNLEDVQRIWSAVKEVSDRPVLLKLSPDLLWTELTEIVCSCADWGVQGFVLTNTSIFRPPGSPFPAEGGLSGKDLRSLSRFALEESLRALGPRRQKLLLVSVGGIENLEEAKGRLDLGADLVQMYSAFAFQGPGLILNWLDELGVH
ncbi:MAG: quinone-dependent dihydroorotate dehydrogenase [Bdellovibrio sp.]